MWENHPHCRLPVETQKKSWYKNHSISPMVGFLNFTLDGRGIDPDIFFDDDGKVWYVGTAAPAKPNFPGEGGTLSVGKRWVWNVAFGKSSFKNNQQKMVNQKKAGYNNSRYLELLPSFFFFVWIPFFLVVFLGHQTWYGNDDSTKPVPRGDLLPCWGPQGWCLCWADLLCLQQSVLHWQDLPTKNQRNERKL